MSIEKWRGSFSRELGGITPVINKTIQAITDSSLLAVYIYLLTKPQDWEINAKEIMNHFGFSKDKMYRLLNVLIDIKLLTREEIREKGKFAKYHYVLFLKPCASIELSPCPDLRDAAERDAVNKDTYKEKKKQRKELTKDISESTDSQKTKAINSRNEDLVPIINIWNEIAVPLGCPKQGKEKRTLQEIRRNIKIINENWEHQLTAENFEKWLKIAIDLKFYLLTKSGYMKSLNVILRWEHFHEAYNKYLNDINNTRR